MPVALGNSPLRTARDSSRASRAIDHMVAKIELNGHFPVAVSRRTMLFDAHAAHAVTADGQRALFAMLARPEIKELLP